MKNSNKKRVVSMILAIALSLSMILSAVAGIMSLKNSSKGTTSSDTTTTQTASYDYSARFDDNGYFKGIKASDYVNLPDYSAYTIPQELTVASQEDIDSEIEYLRSRYSTTQANTTRGTVVNNGDTINLDYVGSVDGVEFTNGSTKGQGTDLTVGSGTYIPARGDCLGFEEQLVGHTVGETFDITVQFPDGYSASTDADGNEVVLSNAVANFRITINSVQETIIPEITDEFISENLSDTYSSYSDLVEKISAGLVKTQKLNYIWNKLGEETEVIEYPAEMLEFEKEMRNQQIETTASYYGFTTENFLAAMGYASADEYFERVKEDMNEDIKGLLINQAICEKENITASDETLDTFFSENYGTTDYSSFEEYYGKNYLKFASLTDTMLAEIISKMAVA